MRMFLTLILTAFLILPVASCANGKTSNTPATAAQKVDYICPMHDHIHGKKGDVCPICGMPLIPAQE